MKILSKTLVGTVAAGAMAISAASPVAAQNRDWNRGHDRDGVSAGDVIAGALIIGGIAAVASAASRDNGRYDSRYDRSGYPNGNYGRYDNAYGGNPRQAVEQCVFAAERGAQRSRWGRGADVTDIREVRQTRYGYEVRGRIAVNGSNRGWRNGDSNYGNGWGNDYRGWNSNLRGYDSGTFKCSYERGRVSDLDYSGIRGL